MKIQISLKTSLMLAMALALTCSALDNLSAAPLQSGSRSDAPIAWSQATGEAVNQAPVQYESTPIQNPQPVYSEEVIVGSEYGQPACSSCAPAPVVGGGCNQPACNSPRAPRRGCGICKRSCGGSQCPSCEGDICKLELDKSKITKTRFKTEQVPVCVPPIRLPWQKCCPPGKSKTRLVTKLKTEKYECPHCAYKWSLVEPEEAKEPEPAAAEQQPQVYESTPVYDSYLPADGQQIVPTETPEVITPGTYTPPSLDSTLNTPATPATPATQSLGNPAAQPVKQPLAPKVESVVPPPPTTGSLPWRAEAPPSS